MKSWDCPSLYKLNCSTKNLLAMIIRVTFCVEVNVRPGFFDKQRIETRSIDGEWDSIDEAFSDACNAGAIPDKLMNYQYD